MRMSSNKVVLGTKDLLRQKLLKRAHQSDSTEECVGSREKIIRLIPTSVAPPVDVMTSSGSTRKAKTAVGTEPVRIKTEPVEQAVVSRRSTGGRRQVKDYFHHPETSITSKSFRCPFCTKSYGYSFHLDRHTRIKHDVIYSKNPVTEFCTLCDEAFCSKANLTRHIRIKHCDGEGMTQNKKCPVCDDNLKTWVSLYEHVKESHPEKQLEDLVQLLFASNDEFLTWKTAEEKHTASYFCSAGGWTRDSGKVYRCHRSGTFQGKGTGVKSMRKRGSCKIGAACPAFIRTKTFQNSEEIEVLYGPSHVGHDADLRFIPLTKQEREQVAAFLRQGCSLDDTLQKVRELLSVTKVPQGSRLHCLKRQDLRNIIRDFHIKGVMGNESSETRLKMRRSHRASKGSGHSQLKHKKAKCNEFEEWLPASKEAKISCPKPLVTQANEEAEDHFSGKPDFVGDDVMRNDPSESEPADTENGLQLALSVHMTEEEIVENSCDYPEPIVFRPSSTALDRARLWQRAGVEQDVLALLERVRSVDPSREDVVSMIGQGTREIITQMNKLYA